MHETTRRQYLRRSAAVALAAVAGCLDSGSPTTDSTPTGDRAGSGPATPTATDSPTGTPQTDPATDRSTGTDDPGTDTTTEPETDTPPLSAPLSWRAGFDAPVTTMPVVDDGWVYAGSEGGTVSRLDADSGDRGWTFDAGVPIQDLAVGDGTVLVVSGTYEFNSGQTFHALDASTGSERWTFGPTNWWLELLAVADGTVYVSTADDALGPGGETLYAVSVADGTELWSAEVGDPREAVLTDDAILVSTYGRFYAFERDSGDERFTLDVEDVTFTTPAVVEGTMVYAYSDYDADQVGVLVGVDVATGEERWRFDDVSVTATVAREGTLYVGGGGVAALDPGDGTSLWHTDTAGFVTQAGVTDDRVYAGGDAVAAYGREDGDRRWEVTPDPPQGGVFVAGRSGDTLLLDAYHDGEPRNQYKFAVDADGSQRWAFDAGAELSDLAVGDGVAVTGGENSRLYGLDPSA